MLLYLFNVVSYNKNKGQVQNFFETKMDTNCFRIHVVADDDDCIFIGPILIELSSWVHVLEIHY